MPFPLNYQVMFVLAFILSLLSLRHVMKIQLRSVPAQPDAAPVANSGSPWRSPVFHSVGFITAVMHIAFFSVFALTPLYLVNKMGASEIFMAAYGLAELGAGAGMALLTPRIAKRIGNRTLIALAMLGTGMGTLVLVLAPTLIFTLPAAALIGGSWTVAGIALFAHFSEVTPLEHKSSYTVAYTQIVFAATFVGPMIGSGLQSGGVSLVSVMLIGAVLRVAAGALTQFDALEWVERKLHIPSFSR